jgi:hypothetical protein
MSPDLRENLLRQFTALPRRGTPVAELTDRDKVALANAAGVPCEMVFEGGYAHMRTKVLVGFVDRGDGGYIIAVQQPFTGDTVTVHLKRDDGDVPEPPR